MAQIHVDTEAANGEMLTDEEAELRMKYSARFWTGYLAVLLVALSAVIGHFLPALIQLLSTP